MNGIDYAIRAVGLLSELVSAGVEIVGFVRQTQARLQTMRSEERDPNEAEWKELNDQIEALRLQLHRPLNVQ